MNGKEGEIHDNEKRQQKAKSITPLAFCLLAHRHNFPFPCATVVSKAKKWKWKELWKFARDLKERHQKIFCFKTACAVSTSIFHHLEQASGCSGKSLNACEQKAIFSANYSSVIELRQFPLWFFSLQILKASQIRRNRMKGGDEI